MQPTVQVTLYILCNIDFITWSNVVIQILILKDKYPQETIPWWSKAEGRQLVTHFFHIHVALHVSILHTICPFVK